MWEKKKLWIFPWRQIQRERVTLWRQKGLQHLPLLDNDSFGKSSTEVHCCLSNVCQHGDDLRHCTATSGFGPTLPCLSSFVLKAFRLGEDRRGIRYEEKLSENLEFSWACPVSLPTNPWFHVAVRLHLQFVCLHHKQKPILDDSASQVGCASFFTTWSCDRRQMLMMSSPCLTAMCWLHSWGLCVCVWTFLSLRQGWANFLTRGGTVGSTIYLWDWTRSRWSESFANQLYK